MRKQELIKKYYDLKNENPKNVAISLEDMIYSDLRKKSKYMKTILPIAVGLRVTDKCNFRCSHCFVQDHSFKEMKIELIEKILKEFGKQKPYRIYLTGGEPFLNSQISEIISYLKREKIQLSIHTNGSLINEKILKVLSENFTDRDYIQISIDASDERLFSEIRKGGELKKVIENCRKLAEINVKFKVNMVITNRNVGNMRDVYELAKEVSAKEIIYSPIMEMENDHSTYLPSDEELLEAFVEVLDYHFQSGELVEIKQDPLAVPWGNPEVNKYMKSSFLMCPAGKTEIEIDMDGNVYTCPFLYGENFCMGNIKQQPLEQIWNNKKFSVFSEKVWSSNQECIRCEQFSVCNGGCIAYAIRNNMDCDGRCKRIKQNSNNF